LLKAQAIWEELVLEHPSFLEYKADLAAVNYELANVYVDTGRSENADQLFQRNLALLEQLVAENPKSPQYRADLAFALVQSRASPLRKHILA
jgi:hypothetical protein